MDGSIMVLIMRRRRRLARLLDKVFASRRALHRELRWLVRDIRDLRRELTRLADHGRVAQPESTDPRDTTRGDW